MKGGATFVEAEGPNRDNLACLKSREAGPKG